MKKHPLLLAACLLCCLILGAAAFAQQSASPNEPQRHALTAILLDGGNVLGVYTENLTRESMSRSGVQGEPHGVVITKVVENSPAARAGLKKDDVITRFDGEPVTSVQKLHRLINEAAPEHNARLTISRGGNEQEINVALGKAADFPHTFESFALPQGREFNLQGEGEMKRRLGELYGQLEKLPNDKNFMQVIGAGRRIGVSTTQLTAQLADFFGVAEGSGLLVTSVAENSPAARGGLKAGDVITEADGAKLKTTLELMHAINHKKGGEITLTIVRDKKTRTIKVTPEQSPDSFNFTPEAFGMSGAFEDWRD